MRIPAPVRFGPNSAARLIVAVLALGVLTTPVLGQDFGPGAIRLFVRPAASVAQLGKGAAITIELRGVSGSPVKAPRTFDVEVLSGGNAARVTIPAGESQATTIVTPASKGILEIRATHPEMLPGTTFLKVAPARIVSSDIKGMAAALRPIASAPRPERKTKAALAVRERPLMTVKDTRRSPISIKASSAAVANESRPAASAAPPPPTQPSLPVVGTAMPADADEPTLLTLRASPAEDVLANGEDASHIYAFVVGDEPPRSPVVVTLFASAGRLEPETIRIPDDAMSAEAWLTSSSPGPVSVEFVSAQPAARLEGNRKIHVAFVPPVAGLLVDPSPKVMTLLDEGEIAVRLVDEHGTTVASHVTRKVSLILHEGRGTLVPSAVEIAAGEFEQRVKFTPTWRGTVVVKASTSGLLDQTGTLVVTAPVLLLVLSAGGGAIGGFLATIKKRSRRWWLRVVLGVVTGFFLYWLALFGLAGTLPRAIAINPVSAVAVAIIGGWFGTEVLDLAAKRLGLKV